MKKNIHPYYTNLTALCSCGAIINFFSTINKKKINIDICSFCHPYFTGKQRKINIGGRIDKFNKRFNFKNK
ncbi:MAG: 50S ribosomal protein L31 [Candidatus Makana argininalis]